MSDKENKIMYASDEATKIETKTITGWVSHTGRFWGKYAVTGEATDA